MATELRVKSLSIFLLLGSSLLASCATSVAGEGSDAVDAAPSQTDALSTNPDSGSEPEPELSITLMPTTLTLDVSQTGTVLATVYEDTVVVNQNVSWQSADPAIASVSDSGQVTGVAAGTTVLTASLATGDVMEMASVSVQAISCIDGTGNNGDSCAAIYQGADIWRCTVSSNLGGQTVSQVCRDENDDQGPKWISFNVDPRDCCSCIGTYTIGCMQ